MNTKKVMLEWTLTILAALILVTAYFGTYRETTPVQRLACMHMIARDWDGDNK